MNILIIEDEESAAVQLTAMLSDHLEDGHFAPVIDNIADARDFLETAPQIDLIFLDINLSDGLSFEIFRDIKVDIPVIFTTAYDQYAIQAFELNSIDYLLKPIRKEKLEQAINKFKRLDKKKHHAQPEIDRVIKLINAEVSYKRNFLLPYKDRLIPVNVADIAWFELKNGLVHCTLFNKIAYLMEEKSLEELSEMLNPNEFYRANRQFLINRKAIKDIQYYFNGRLFVNLLTKPEDQVLISKAKAMNFKEWLKGK